MSTNTIKAVSPLVLGAMGAIITAMAMFAPGINDSRSDKAFGFGLTCIAGAAGAMQSGSGSKEESNVHKLR
jgi:hypothetical protein